MHSEQELVKKGAANLQRGIETVGGMLFLRHEDIEFRPHKLNVQTNNLVLKVSKITSVEKCWVKFLNLIPLFPNAIKVNVEDGEFVFVVFGRKEWISAIESCRSSNGRK